MKRIILPLFAIFLCSFVFVNIALSQIEQQFIKRYTSALKNVDVAKFARVDNSGNCIVAGTANARFTLLKYSKTGTPLDTLTSTAMDTLTAMAVDNNGNYFYAGISVQSAALNYSLIKVTADTIAWTKSVDFGGNEVPTGIAIDTSNNVYLTGYRMVGNVSVSRNVDYYTVKYVGETGDTIYSRRYNNGSSNLEDYARGIVYSPTDNTIIVTGETNQLNENYNYYTIKYNALTGDSLWSKKYHNSQDDKPTGIAIDNSGNIYVTGNSIGTLEDIFTVKYSSSGTQVWTKRYTGQRTDYARALYVDNSSNIFVVGASYIGTEHDIVTIKYNSSGVQQWINTYNGAGSGQDEVTDIKFDPYGNILITGYENGLVNGSSSYRDCLLLMLNSSGVLRKANTYTGVSISADTAYPFPGVLNSIAIDQSTGAVWAVGQDSGAASSTDFIVIKYESRNSIRGYIKRDTDGSTATTNDQTSFSGSKVVLDSAGIRLDSVYSDAKGNYTVPLVFNGEYTLIHYPPDNTWQTVGVSPGSGGNSQTGNGTNKINVNVSNSQVSINNGFFAYTANDTLKYRTLTLEDYGVKKPNKITKFIKKVNTFLTFPNSANIRETIFAREFPKKTTKKFIVGVIDSPVTRWWVWMQKSSDIQKAYPMKQKAKYFVTYAGVDKPGEKKGLLKAPNHLAGEQIALKMNLLGSKYSILTPGLANLLYDDGDVNNALNGFTIGEIANLVDSLLTFRGRPLASMNSETVLPSTADSVLTRINRAFRYHPSFSDTILDKLDTLKYLDTTQLIAGGLRIGGGNPISVAPYLRFNPNPLAKNEIDFPSLNIPNEFSLYQNYPNPFNPVTTISFDLPVRSIVTMKVYNILGQVVATLSNNEILEEGTHELQFDASPFASGVYFARISAQSSKHSFEDFKKMILIK